jgi:hypothetical protein
VEALQRLLSLGIDKIRAAGIVAEDVALAIVDSVMNTAIDFLQTSRRLLPDNNLVTAK